MEILGIRRWRFLVAAMAAMGIGFLWYSPILFVRPWTLAMGYDPNRKSKLDEMRKGTGKPYAIALVASLLSAFVLAKIVELTTVNRVRHGMKVGFAIWLGFVTIIQLTATLLEKKPTKLYLINTGYPLVCYAVMAAILAVWQ